MAGLPLTSADLRGCWQPIKERLNAAGGGHPTAVRMHRALSWLQRAERCPDSSDDDVQLVCLWIAFNSLYCRWDVARREPLPDRTCWEEFVARLVALDRDERIGQLLQSERQRVMSILDDEHLSKYFWEDPGPNRSRQSKKGKYDACGWYNEKKWRPLSLLVIDRIYLLRCQIFHGAATHGSQLNRKALRCCTEFFRSFLQTALLVMIDQGAGEDWGVMCYPPLESARLPTGS